MSSKKLKLKLNFIQALNKRFIKFFFLNTVNINPDKIKKEIAKLFSLVITA